MKKIFALLLAAVLLCSAMTVAVAADDLDLSFVRNNKEVYTIDLNDKGTAAFIESQLSAKDRSFVHKYESSTRYSNTMFDVLIVDYDTDDAYPVFRLWISYYADDSYVNLHSASIILGDEKYTFSDIDDPDWRTKDEDGYAEQLLIKFDEETLPFLAKLESMLPDDADDLDDISIKMILHGDEDITVEIGRGFLMDFMFIKTAMININGLQYLERAYGSDMSVTTVK